MNKNSRDTILINETNLHTGIAIKEQITVYSGQYWHKLYLDNALEYERDYVLRTLMKAVHPLDFIPVCYAVEGEHVSFLLKNCGAAIIELCRLNLVIPQTNSEPNKKPFKIAILLKHASAAEMKIEIQHNVGNILKKRYNQQTKTLNLDAFCKDPELREFCPLSQPKLMYFVLHLSREFDIEKLKLANNEIELLKPMEALATGKLRSLDLKNNNISSEQQLNVLKSFNLIELNLENNPIVQNASETEYNKTIRKFCTKIDRMERSKFTMCGMHAFHRNFLCDVAGHDLLDQFMEHFFNLYDSPDRSLLESLYHKDAMFSISSQYITGQTTSNSARLSDYKRVSRNIKTLSDFSKSDEALFIGAPNIAKLYQFLPNTEHDPYTFTVDLTYYTEKSVIFTVTGVFREPVEKLLDADRVFGFSRVFVLLAGPNQEYNIINEQLFVANATSGQHLKAFKSVRVQKPDSIYVPNARSTFERKDMIHGFMALSCLNYEWAKKCLEEVEYDLKKGLQLFVNLFKADQFPSEAFNSGLQAQPIESMANPASQMEIHNNITPIIAPYTPCIQDTIHMSKNVQPQTKPLINIPLKNTPTPPQIINIDVDEPAPVITDPVITAALNMSMNIDEQLARKRLGLAAALIMDKYTYAVKHYRALGKEFYKFRFLAEARKFLEDAMRILPKKIGEEIFSMFTLYEIQSGDMDIAADMVAETAKTYPIAKTMRFIGEHIAKINVDFAHKMFLKTINMGLMAMKRDALRAAHIAFKEKYNINDIVVIDEDEIDEASTRQAEELKEKNKLENIKIHEAKQLEEERKKAEAIRIHEAKQLEEEKKRLEAKKNQEAKKLEEEKKKLEAKKIQDAKKLEEEKKKLEAKKIEEAKKLEEEKKKLEARKIQEAKKLEEEKKKLEARKIQDAKKLEAEKKKLEARKIEEAKKLEEEKKKLEARKIQEANQLEEERKQLEAKKIQEANELEEARKQLEARKIQEAKQLEKERNKLEAEKQRIAQEKEQLDMERRFQEEEKKKLARAKAELAKFKNQTEALQANKDKEIEMMLQKAAEEAKKGNIKKSFVLTTEVNQLAKHKAQPPDTTKDSTVKEEDLEIIEFQPLNFSDFRREILTYSTILNKKNSVIDEFLLKEGTVKEILETGYELIDVYDTDITILKGVCHKFWEYNEHDKVRSLLETTKIKDSQLSAIKLFYNVRANWSIDKDQTKAYIQDYVKKSIWINLAQLFDDFAKFDKDMTVEVYVFCLNNNTLPEVKLKLLSSMYHSFVKEHKRTELYMQANHFCKQYNKSVMDSFHPNDVVRFKFSNVIRTTYLSRERYKMPLEQIYNLKGIYPKRLETLVEFLRALFYHGYRKEARKQMGKLIKHFPKGSKESLQFFVSCIVFEACYGDKEVAQSRLENSPYRDHIHYSCPKAHVAVQLNSWDEFKSIMWSMIKDVDILSVSVLDTLHKYYSSWMTVNSVDLLKILKT